MSVSRVNDEPELAGTSKNDEIEFAPDLPVVASSALQVVTAQEFAAVDEPGTEALIGDPDNVLVGEGTDAMLYGDGGAGKTTLTLDLGCHLAAGDDWLGLRVARPVRVLFVENEGPRPLFRAKVRRKIEGWAGAPIADRILVSAEPWATFSFADEDDRAALAEIARLREVDVVVVGPVTASGMEEAGTLQDVRAFAALLEHVRTLSGRRLAFVLVHHENKGGKVSGAWEGCGDTLLHVQGQGHGRTRVYVQKARWASEQHGTTLQLLWTDGDGFRLEETVELDDETIAEKIVDAIRENAGTTWTKVPVAMREADDKLKVGNEKLKALRDGLFAAGRIVNIVKQDGAEVATASAQERRPTRLFVAEDPSVAHLRQSSGADPVQAAPPSGALVGSSPAPCAVPYNGAGVGADHGHPQPDLFEAQS